QSVLLKGINDDPNVQLQLVRGLLKMRVRPYYLYQCEVLKGTAHFRTSLEDGISIIEHLQGWTSGLAVPRFVIDSPIGKIPIAPDTIVERDEDSVVLRNYEGRLCRMINHRKATRVVQDATGCPAAAVM
ncbi:MAG: lysine 2,3-aminomutase, partial [Firmicutes bacterium]|nr:lysine 2,3-aminomutase [Bacillota bacterium]